MESGPEWCTWFMHITHACPMHTTSHSAVRVRGSSVSILPRSEPRHPSAHGSAGVHRRNQWHGPLRACVCVCTRTHLLGWLNLTKSKICTREMDVVQHVCVRWIRTICSHAIDSHTRSATFTIAAESGIGSLVRSVTKHRALLVGYGYVYCRTSICSLFGARLSRSATVDFGCNCPIEAAEVEERYMLAFLGPSTV